MKSKSIDRQTTAKAVAERLRTEILRGELAPSSRLTQNEVADRLGVSTTPVREAFALLEADGLLRLDQYRGAVVYQPTLDEIIELFEMRIVLERLAIEKAVPNMTQASIAELQTLLDRMRTESEENRLELHRDWHALLLEPAERPRLTKLVSSLRAAARSYSERLQISGRTRADEDDDHQAILDACRARDIEAAVRMMGQHVRVAHEEALQELEHSDGHTPPVRTDQDRVAVG